MRTATWESLPHWQMKYRGLCSPRNESDTSFKASLSLGSFSSSSPSGMLRAWGMEAIWKWCAGRTSSTK
uniref:Uncharacterized protein n=1 Tax=Arundo donax TaxID=35708 RepID=A0A0A8YGM5_ARUDO